MKKMILINSLSLVRGIASPAISIQETNEIHEVQNINTQKKSTEFLTSRIDIALSNINNDNAFKIINKIRESNLPFDIKIFLYKKIEKNICVGSVNYGWGPHSMGKGATINIDERNNFLHGPHHVRNNKNPNNMSAAEREKANEEEKRKVDEAGEVVKQAWENFKDFNESKEVFEQVFEFLAEAFANL